MKSIWLLSLGLFISIASFAKTDSIQKVYKLPQPQSLQPSKQKPSNKKKATELAELFKKNEVARLSDMPLTLDLLSTLLNNLDPKKVPQIKDLLYEEGDEYNVLVVTDKGAYRFNKKENTLNLMQAGDYRGQFAEENKNWKKAKCFLVAELTKDEPLFNREELELLKDARSFIEEETALLVSPEDMVTESDKTPTKGEAKKDSKKAKEKLKESPQKAEKEQKTTKEKTNEVNKEQKTTKTLKLNEHDVFLVVDNYSF
jgi:hypothetical protein